ncbi:MAG TPA: hypothetical protein VKI61_15960 [Chitinophagaceae bacterium]|jgi:hypothetical protein|nr:hypothetical protein [Chitinophagaceae bacterium]
MNGTANSNQKFNLLRIVAIIISIVGGLISGWLTIEAGQNNKSILLKSIFVIWVISPFAAILRAYSISKDWSILRRGILYNLMIIIAFISMVAYSGQISLPDVRPAFLFLIVPAFCWALMIAAYLIVNYRKRK